MSNQETPAAKRPKGRSPNYPAIDLAEAIVKARELYKAELQHPASVSTVVKDWGYKTPNGPAGLALAALKRFGLTDDDGLGPARRVRVSDLALDILENPDDAAKVRAIHRAAFSPPIHRVMWEKYGDQLPSDSNIKWFLTKEKGFTETGAKEFIGQYRNTIAYAHSFGPVNIEPEVETEDDFDEEVVTPGRSPQIGPRRGIRNMTDTGTYFVPIAAGLNVAVEGPFPLTEIQWEQFQAVLTAMKPALVADEVATPKGLTKDGTLSGGKDGEKIEELFEP